MLAWVLRATRTRLWQRRGLSLAITLLARYTHLVRMGGRRMSPWDVRRETRTVRQEGWDRERTASEAEEADMDAEEAVGLEVATVGEEA